MTGTSQNVDALQALIAAEIAADPTTLDGFVWCALPQPLLASKLGVSVETLRRLLRDPPFVRKRRQGQYLVRVGEPGPETPNDVARRMGCYFNAAIRKNKEKWQSERQAILDKIDVADPAFSILPAHVDLSAMFADLDKQHKQLGAALGGLKKKIDPKEGPSSAIVNLKRVVRLSKLLARPDRHTTKEFGCMNGLAEVWPVGHQMELFKMVLKQWPRFMAGVKWAEAMADGEFNRHLEFASITVMRKHWKVALEMSEMDAQDAGKQPVWLKAMTTFKPK